MVSKCQEHDDEKSTRQVDDGPDQCGDAYLQYHHSFPMSFQTPTKQRDSSDLAFDSPTCQERIHYPIFNPHDPRHNPSIVSTSCPGISYMSKTPSPQRPIRWVQELPGRSLRKARSGLLALTNGMKCHSVLWDRSAKQTVPGSSSICPPSQEQLSSYRGYSFPQTLSEASTEVDPDFGVEIYRTSRNCSKPESISSWDDEVAEVRLSSSLTLVSPNTLSKVDLGASRRGTSIPKKQDHSSSSQEPGRISQLSDVSSKKPTIRWHDGYVRRSFLTAESDASVPVSSSSCSTPRSNNKVQRRIMGATTESSSYTESSASETSSGESDQHATTELTPRPHTEVSGTSTDDPFMSELSRRGSSDSTDDTSFELSEELRQIAGAIQRLTTDFDMYDDSSCDDTKGNDEENRQPYSSCDIDEMPIRMLGSRPGPETATNRSGGIAPSPYISLRNAPRWSVIPPPSQGDDLPLRDEYFLVDGKSNGNPPGRGDDRIRAEKRIVSDGSIHSGPGLDRDPGVRAHFIPQMIGPGSPRRRVASRREDQARVERNGTDSTDEYISTYRILRQRFRSWSD
ncbi:hypothetical protein AOR_1_1146054 [Paecilomyces variotii No. 5]|uniref:Uncharacterized protein n=1 Tax=Byssochlamys spectabilis (strain No. 5 / NBRC 109023) TaxID=1356009 RepID=V5FV63_BYSSN|nr:hypothetical protein AOR_1_1146054 [Paecilomyces variotii No. 5]